MLARQVPVAMTADRKYGPVEDMMVQPAAPAKSSREERKEKEATKHVQPPGTISAEEITARIPMEREME